MSYLAKLKAMDDSNGKLVQLREGKYLLAPGEESPLFKSVTQKNEALLLEHQGVDMHGAACWHVFVDGDVVVAWENDFINSR